MHFLVGYRQFLERGIGVAQKCLIDRHIILTVLVKDDEWWTLDLYYFNTLYLNPLEETGAYFTYWPILLDKSVRTIIQIFNLSVWESQTQ